MGQVKIYGNKGFLDTARNVISDAIHRCTVEVLGLPPEKRFHRFIGLEQEDFIYPDDRSEHYLIIEVNVIAGRSTETKKAYIRSLISSLSEACNIHVNDIEVTIFESPIEHWGIRGKPADELKLNYKIDK